MTTRVEGDASVSSANDEPEFEAHAEPEPDGSGSGADVESDFDVRAGNSADGDGRRLRRVRLGRVLVFGVLPAVAMLLAAASGYLKFQDSSLRDAGEYRTQSVQAAKDGTVAILSYRPDSVEQNLGDAQQRLTGDFKGSYAKLTHDVVIPGAKERQISALASVPAAASVSADAREAVVIVFVNQTTVIGDGAPSATASTVKVSLRNADGKWLIDGFDPI